MPLNRNQTGFLFALRAIPRGANASGGQLRIGGIGRGTMKNDNWSWHGDIEEWLDTDKKWTIGPKEEAITLDKPSIWLGRTHKGKWLAAFRHE